MSKDNPDLSTTVNAVILPSAAKWMGSDIAQSSKVLSALIFNFHILSLHLMEVPFEW